MRDARQNNTIRAASEWSSFFFSLFEIYNNFSDLEKILGDLQLY